MFLLAAAALTLPFAPRAEAQGCFGDCDDDGEVRVHELLLGVRIALGDSLPAACPAFNSASGGPPQMPDLIRAVGNGLNGCPTCTPPPGGRCVEIEPGPEAPDAILTALLEAQPKDVILLKAGTYELAGQLSLNDVDDVTVRGQGMDKTILRFAGQTSGGESFLVDGSDRFTLENLALEDGPGDLFKVVGANDVTMRRVRTEWTNGPDTDNGAYGLYPVQCNGVLIEDSVVKGASDAGVYVGQSRNIIVRRNRVEDNVAGIEIENSTFADVYDNVATHNTGGILVFNLPGPPVQDGARTRVYNNQSVENNTPNFGKPGNTVSAIPAGSGMFILSNDRVEVFGNTFRDNNSAHIFVIGFKTAEILGGFTSTNPLFDPFSESIFILDNVYEGGGTQPDPSLAALIAIIGAPLPDIVTDGVVDPAKLVDGVLPDNLRLCVQEDPSTTIVNFDLDGLLAGAPNIVRDLAAFDCEHPRLAPVVLGPLRTIEIAAGPGAAEALTEALLEAQAGDEIVLGAGMFEIPAQLSLTVPYITLRGAGMDETILSFDQLTGGGEGLLVRADNFVIEDIGLEDSPGDQLKILGADGVTIRRVRAEWTNGPDAGNGAYGLYPVQCRDVLIEDSVVKGASDAGVYVGQSRNVIVRRNTVEFNVAGIEIENTTGADVYENVATDNTGGILVFNLPGLPVYGGRTRVFNNNVYENNTDNFAPPGNIVAGVPTGSGLFILANDQVEAFGNILRDNNSAQVTLISYNSAVLLGSGAPATDPAFDPFSESIFLYDNTFIGGGTMPDPDLAAIVAIIGGLPVPQIFFDGDIDPAKKVDGELPAHLRTCVQEAEDTTYINLDVQGLVAGTPNISRDKAQVDCTLDKLPSITIPGVQ
ncbi:MAG: parallel beta-helix domain-containing protein [Candidatus Binatia bacterium]